MLAGVVRMCFWDSGDTRTGALDGLVTLIQVTLL